MGNEIFSEEKQIKTKMIERKNVSRRNALETE